MTVYLNGKVADSGITITTVFSSVVLDQDRTSIVVNKAGHDQVAIDITLTEGGGGPFDASGDILVLAGDNASLVEADALAVPRWVVTTDEVLKLELETAFPYIALFYNFTSDGDDDTITASITLS